MKPDMAVVIATWQRTALLKRCLQAPVLSVYWTIYGAFKFKIFFL